MNLHRFLVVVLLALGWAVSSHAQIVLFSNLSQPTATTSEGFLGTLVRYASDFRTDGTASLVTELTAELGNGDAAARTFTFGIYADVSGKPGALVGNFATSSSIPATTDPGQVKATSGVGITLQPNTVYWVMGQGNESGFNTNWKTTVSGSTDSGSLFATLPTQIQGSIFGGAFGDSDVGDLKYSLKGFSPVPEPETWAALAVTTGGFLALRRRRLIRRRQG